MVDADRLIRDLLTRLQEAYDGGETEVHASLAAILSCHGTLTLRSGRYTFAVATAAVYDSNGHVRQRVCLPDALAERVLREQ